MANRDEFNQIISNLIGGDNFIPFEGFDASALAKFAEHQDVFWEGVLKYMQNENSKDELKHFGIRQNDFPNNGESVVEFINNKADLSEDFIGKLLENTNKGENNHWNESFKKLIELYGSIYRFSDETIDSTNITYDDIRQADAGHSFELAKEWVRPWKNVDNKNYEDVRANDKILRVLTDEKKLQFTNIQHMYMRLLMPEYERIVEVEDLDRNFWVIGQVITGILSFLFDPNNPLNELLDGILDEIIQLWENMLYLWVMLALISQQYLYEAIQPIVIPINNDELRPYVKFDDFTRNNFTQSDDIAVLKSCWKRLSHLKEQYSESSLVVIPEIRQNNYSKNYYSAAYYPGMIIYNRRYAKPLTTNTVDTLIPDDQEGQRTIFCSFSSGEDLTGADVPTGSFIVNLNDTKNKENCVTIANKKVKQVWGVYEESPYYYFTSNFLSLESQKKRILFSGAIRTVFDTVTLEYNTDGTIKEVQCNAKLYDTGYYLYQSIKKGDIKPITTFKSVYNPSNAFPKSGGIFEEFWTPTNPPESSAQSITEGYYRGEMPSWYSIANPKFKILICKNWIVPQGTDTENVSGEFEIELYRSSNANPTLKKVNSYTVKYNKNESKTETTTESLQAYDATGFLYKYIIKEVPQNSPNYWASKVDNIVASYGGETTLRCTNTWEKIQYSGQPIMLNLSYNNNNGSSSGSKFDISMNGPESELTNEENYWKTIQRNNYDDMLNRVNYNQEVSDITDWRKNTELHWEKLVEDYAINGNLHNPADSWKGKTDAEKKAAALKPNSLGFYYCHLGYKEGNAGFFESSPYCSVAISNSTGEIKFYHYRFEVNLDYYKKDIPGWENLRISHQGEGNYNKVPFPHGGANYTKIRATNVLCQYINVVEREDWYKQNGIPMPSLKAIKEGIYVIGPNQKEQIGPVNIEGDTILKNWTYAEGNAQAQYIQGVPCGNLRYNSTTVHPSFDNGEPKLNNFIINVWDRACAGTSNWKTVFPYYYFCTIKTGCSSLNNNFGVIEATLIYNDASLPELPAVNVTGVGEVDIRKWGSGSSIVETEGPTETNKLHKIKSLSANTDIKYLLNQNMAYLTSNSKNLGAKEIGANGFNMPEITFDWRQAEEDQFNSKLGDNAQTPIKDFCSDKNAKKLIETGGEPI